MLAYVLYRCYIGTTMTNKNNTGTWIPISKFPLHDRAKLYGRIATGKMIKGEDYILEKKVIEIKLINKNYEV